MSSAAPYALDDPPQGETRNKLKTLNGVYIPCCLNILGIILFLRLGWAVGQAGILGVFGIFALAETQALLTVLSLSAMVSNGSMEGGGSYFMISRALGPDFGGSIGVLFYTAYAIGCAFYATGFGTEVQQTWYPDVDPELAEWIVLAAASLCLLLVLMIALVGAGLFARVNIIIFAIQMGAIFLGILSFLSREPFELEHGGQFVGMNATNFVENLSSDYTVDQDSCRGQCTWHIVFAIVFPAATGIMEGANLSGDLRDPAKSIPKGTINAVFSAILVYVSLILTMGAAFDRDALQNNLSMFQDATFSPWIIVVGVVVSTISSALGSLFGGARVAQALARDQLLPLMGPLKQGSRQGDEPQYSVLFTWFIAQCCLFIGNLDDIATVATSIFCLSYSITNFSCFIVKITGAPNFRPRFKFYSWWASLIGCLLNFGVMFYLDAWYGAVALVLLIGIFGYINANVPPTEWGDVSQALIFHQVRKYLLRLEERSHPKNWRPSILLLVDDLDVPLIDVGNNLKKGGLYVLGSVLVGEFDAHLSSECLDVRRSLSQFIKRKHLKALPQVAVAPTARLGYQFLMLCSGLGGMNVNTVVVPLWTPAAGAVQRRSLSYFRGAGAGASAAVAAAATAGTAPADDELDAEAARVGAVAPEEAHLSVTDDGEFVDVLRDTLLLRKNLVVMGNFTEMDRSMISLGGLRNMAPSARRHTRCATPAADCHERHSVDVWITHEWSETDVARMDSELALCLQLAHILHQNRSWGSTHRLRVLHVIPSAQRATMERKLLQQLIVATRLEVRDEDIVVLPLEGGAQADPAALRQLIVDNSFHTSVAFLTLPPLPAAGAEAAYVQQVNESIQGLPPVLLVAKGQDNPIIATTI